MNSSIEIVRNNRLAKEIVLVDGPPRAGKSMLGFLIGSFDRVEIERIEAIIESIPLFYNLKKLEKDAAIALLRREIDIKVYDSMISRNVNFRTKDRTGVFYYANFTKYLKRLLLEDGDSVVKRINNERPIFQCMTHDMLHKIDLFYDAFGDGLRVLEMVRHPVDLVHSMFSRGYGDDIGKNPRYWEHAINADNQDVPYYAIGWTDEFLAISPMERVIRILETLVNKMHDKWEILSCERKKQVLVLSYEDLVTDSHNYLDLIAKFLGSRQTIYTKKALKKLKLPNTISPKGKEKKFKFIKERASDDYLKILYKMVEEYEAKKWGIFS